MRLWWLELKKMFLNRNIFLLILVLLMVNGCKIYLGSMRNPELMYSRAVKEDTDFAAFEQGMEGKMTAEKARKIKNGYEMHQAFLIGTAEYDKTNEYFNNIYELFQYQYDYHRLIQETVEKAEDNLAFYGNYENDQEIKKNRLLVETFSDRYIQNYYNCVDFEFLFEYDFSTLLVLLLSLGLAGNLFYREQLSGTEQLLFTSAVGRKKSAIIKLLAFFAFLLLIAMLFYSEDVVIHSFLFRLDGWMNPVYSIPDYQFCAFSGSILGYYLLLCVVKYAAVISMACLFALVTQLIRHYVLPILLNILFVVVCIVLSEQSGFVNTAALLNPISLMQPDSFLRSISTVSLFGHPVIAVYAGMAFMVIIAIIIVVIIQFFFRRQHKTVIRVRRMHKKSDFYLLKMEWHRIFVKNKFWILIPCLLVLKLILLCFDVHYINTEIEQNHDAYVRYIETCEGELTEENEGRLTSDYADLLAASQAYTELMSSYQDNRLDASEFAENSAKLNNTLKNADVLTLVHEEYLYVKEDPVRRHIMYTNGWEAFLANERLDGVMIFVLLLFSCFLFAYDYDSGTNRVICTTINGKSQLYLVRQKMLFGFIPVMGFLLYLAEYIFFSMKYGLPSLTAPIQSLVTFRSSPFEISIFIGCIVIFLLKMLGYFLLAQLAALLSNLIKKVWLSGIISALLVLVPFALFNKETVRYMFQPLGFLLGSGYLKGKVSFVMVDGVQISEPFDGISVSLLSAFIVGGILLCAVLFVCTLWLCSLSGKRFRLSKTVGVVLAAGIASAAAVCAVNIMTQENVYNFGNTYSRGMGFSDESNIYFSYDTLTKTDIRDGSTDDVIRDVMKKPSVDDFYVDENYVYYLQKDFSKREVSYYRIDRYNYDEKLIFRETKGIGAFKQTTKYLGLIDVKNYDNTSTSVNEKNEITDFWVDGEYLFTADSDSVDMINLVTGQSTELIHELLYTECVAYNRGIIYYANMMNEVYSYDISTKQTEKLSIEKCRRLYFCDDRLCFLDFENHIGVYEDGNTEIYSEACVSPTSCLSSSEDYVFFVNDKNQLAALDLDTGSLTVENTDKMLYNVCAFVHSDAVYVYWYDEERQQFEWSLYFPYDIIESE